MHCAERHCVWFDEHAYEYEDEGEDEDEDEYYCVGY